MSAPPPPLSALPSSGARLLAFVAILVAGACGGLIGYAITDLQCGPETVVQVAPPPSGTATTNPTPPTTTDTDTSDDDGCATAAALGGLAGAVVGAGGVAVIAVLVLRAMGEWRRSGGSPAGDGPPGGRFQA